MRTNPNGANQYLLDPRQKMCWDSYVDPKSETFGNATQSAIKAGYDDEYAEAIMQSEWFSGKLRRLNLLGKAEKRLEKMLDLELTDAPMEDLPKRASLIGIQTDVAKFVAETQGKSEGYSKRQELSGPNGKDLPSPILLHALSSHNSDEKDRSDATENTGSSGGNVSVEDGIHPALLDTLGSIGQDANGN